MLTLAIAQFRPDKGAYAGNLARLGGVFKEVGTWPDPPGLVVGPESALTGYFLEGGVRDLALPAEHFSLYELTIKPGTAFERAVRRGALSPPGDETAAAFYEITQDICDAAGVPAYEISNHARTLDARSRHNLNYWRGGEWLGVGLGAPVELEIW